MIAKLAFRNLIRLPWRTILYFISVFFITVTMTASIFVYGACLDAKRALDENYIFVASLIGRDKSSLSLSDISCCLDDEDVLAFNVTMSEGEGVLPGGETMFRLPSTTDRGEPVVSTEAPGPRPEVSSYTWMVVFSFDSRITSPTKRCSPTYTISFIL